MKRYALIVGIEDFKATDNFSHVDFAAADANDISKVLGSIGAEVCLLINDQATHERVTKALTEILKTLKPEDVFWFFYAGHGRVDSFGRTRLACCDSGYTTEIENGLSLSEVLGPFTQSDAPSAIILLDACNTGQASNPPPVFSQAEVLETAKSPNILLFSACRPNESAYPNEQQKHGAWTHHLLQAMQGLVPQALAHGRFLDPYLLQGYLRNVVPEDVESLHKQAQHPSLYGTFSGQGYLLDVGHVLKPLVKRSYAHWRVPVWIKLHQDQNAAHAAAQAESAILLQKFIKILEAKEAWNRDNGRDRNIRWDVAGAIIDITVTPYDSTEFVASDVIFETDSSQTIRTLLDARIAPYFCVRDWLVDDPGLDALFGSSAHIAIGSSTHRTIRANIDGKNNRRIEIHVENLDPDHRGMLHAHDQLSICVLNSLNKGYVNPRERSRIADACF